MKILHIIPSLNKGGAERLVLDICNELNSKKDIHVKLITFCSNNAYSFLSETLDWEVIPAHVTPSITGKTLVEVAQLQQAIENFQPDVIHSHLFESEMVLSQINYPTAKYVVHFHDNMAQFENFTIDCLKSKRNFTNYFEKRKVLKSYKTRKTEFIAISMDTVNYLKSVLPVNFQKTLLLNAIDLKRFAPALDKGEKNRLCIIGSLVDKKGQELAIRTIYELQQRKINVYLDILGEGSMRTQLEKRVEELKLDKKIIFHGNVDHPEHFLQHSLAYLHTAKYEPFGLVLIEAMASGLAVVCTDGKGNRDLILEGENGFMVWERDPKLLADKIELLIKNDDLRREMGEKARLFAQGFGIENYVDKLLTIYRN